MAGMQTWLKRLILPALALLLGLYIFSPYRHEKGFRYKLIKHSVVINAPRDSVFRFLGNSANARHWSVFVHHISPLNGNEVPDGQVGSKRRCYCNADETSTQWDEVLTQVEPNVRRQISCYNLVDFAVSTQGLGTEQLYRSLGARQCELSFTLFYLTQEASVLDQLKTAYAAYYVKYIFQQNMDNIKRILENGN